MHDKGYYHSYIEETLHAQLPDTDSGAGPDLGTDQGRTRRREGLRGALGKSRLDGKEQDIRVLQAHVFRAGVRGIQSTPGGPATPPRLCSSTSGSGRGYLGHVRPRSAIHWKYETAKSMASASKDAGVLRRRQLAKWLRGCVGSSMLTPQGREYHRLDVGLTAAVCQVDGGLVDGVEQSADDCGSRHGGPGTRANGDPELVDPRSLVWPQNHCRLDVGRIGARGDRSGFLALRGGFLEDGACLCA